MDGMGLEWFEQKIHFLLNAKSTQNQKNGKLGGVQR